MSDPLGAWNLPFEQMPQTDVVAAGVLVDSVTVSAAVMDTPAGVFPVLSISFASSHRWVEEQPAPILLVGTVEVLENFRRLVSASVTAAVKAAKGARS